MDIIYGICIVFFVGYLFPIARIASFLSLDDEWDFFLFQWNPTKNQRLFIIFCPIVNAFVGFSIVFIFMFMLSFIGPVLVMSVIDFVKWVLKKEVKDE